jgi:hypothetical protein
VNGVTLGDLAQTRLVSQIPGRTIYLDAVPDGTLPPRYIIVRTSEGTEEANRAVDVPNRQTPHLWATSVSRNHDPRQAAREAKWGAAQVRIALRGWRPDARWRLKHEASLPARRDESISETTFFAVEQFRLPSSI